MKVEIVTEATQFLSRDYSFQIFCIVSLQCMGPFSMHVEAYANAIVVSESYQNYKSSAVSKPAHGLWRGGGGGAVFVGAKLSMRNRENCVPQSQKMSINKLPPR